MNFRISTDWSLISIVVLLAPGSCLSASASIDRDIAASSRICLASSRARTPFLTSAAIECDRRGDGRHVVSRVIELVHRQLIHGWVWQDLCD